MQFSSLFASIDVSKGKIRCQLHFLNWKKFPPDGNLTVKPQCKEEDHSQDLSFSEMKNCQNQAHYKGFNGTYLHCLNEKLLSN